MRIYTLCNLLESSEIVKNPAIQNACAVSVFDTDQMTELAAAAVIKSERYAITEDEIYALVAGVISFLSDFIWPMAELLISFFILTGKLAKYKWLDGGIYFVDAFPMTPSDKVIRSKVKEMAQQLFELKKK